MEEAIGERTGMRATQLTGGGGREGGRLIVTRFS